MNNILNRKEQNKIFYKTLFLLCIPIIMENIISTSVNIIDTVMISSLGETSVAAIGICNQFFFLFSMTMAGLTGGAGLFISQFFGKNDIKNIKKVTALNVLLGIICSLFFFIPALFFPKLIVNLFSHDSTVVDLCIKYFKIISFSYPLIAISMVFSMGSRGVRNPKLGMISSAIALVLNVCLNTLLIFGNLGFPKLGVRGAAIATVIARSVQLLILLWYVYFFKKDYALKFKLLDFKSIDKTFVSTFLAKSVPIFINDSTWAIGTVLYSVAYAKAGTSAIALSQIASSSSNFFITAGVCVAIGASIMIGNELGADNKTLAIYYANKFSKLVFIIGTFFGLLLILTTPFLLKIFNVSNSLSTDATKIFIVIGLFMGLKTYNTLVVIGILRSGGDTKYALFLEMGCMWFVSLPLTFIAAIYKVPIYLLVLLSSSEEIVKFIFGFPRALSKKWATNIVKDIS